MITTEEIKAANTAARFYIRQRNRKFERVGEILGGSIPGIGSMSISEVANLFDADLSAVRAEVSVLDARV